MKVAIIFGLIFAAVTVGVAIVMFLDPGVIPPEEKTPAGFALRVLKSLWYSFLACIALTLFCAFVYFIF